MLVLVLLKLNRSDLAASRSHPWVAIVLQDDWQKAAAATFKRSKTYLI